MPWEPTKYGAIVSVDLSTETIDPQVEYVRINDEFAPQIIDCYLKNYVYECRRKHSEKTINELINDIFPVSLKHKEKFIIVHTAKDVEYNIINFCTKII